jgi:FkbM family methyltransferase
LPAWFYPHLWFHGAFTARVKGANFRMVHVGARVENEIFWRNTFVGERAVTDLIAQQAYAIDAFLDVGANSGFYSLMVAALNRQAAVFAFEPSLANLRVLEHNVAINDMEITLVPEAVTSSDGSVTFYDWDEISYSASLEKDFHPGGKPRMVQGVKLDTFAEKNGLFGRKLLLKIDVEGHEIGVLEGARELIATAVGAVVELLTTEAVAAAASTLGADRFRFSRIDESAQRLVDLTTQVRAGEPVQGGNYFLQPARAD